MRMDYKYTAIIMSKRDIGEYDRMYTAYTKESGKIRLIARGVRKPNSKLAGNIEPITEVELIIAKNRGRGQLTAAIPATNFMLVKTELVLLERVFYVFRVLAKMITEEEPDAKLYSLLTRYLMTLDKLPIDEKTAMRADVLTAGFIYKLLGLAGYGIEAHKCVSCGAALGADGNYFSMSMGGTICASCQKRDAQKIRIGHAAIKAFRIMSKNKLESLVKLSVSPEDLKNIKLVLDGAVKWIVG